MGPAVIGGRPQGFLNPRPEPDPNKTVRADWFNPAPRRRLSTGGVLSGRCRGLSATADDDLHLSLQRCGCSTAWRFVRAAAGRLFLAGSSANDAGRNIDFTRGGNRGADCLRQEDRFPLTARVRPSYDEMAESTSHSAAIALRTYPQTSHASNSQAQEPQPGHGGPAPKSRTAPRRHKPKRAVVRKADDTGLVRLQKVLAAAGVGSRRQCEEIIRQGRVDVDGKTVTELGTRVDPFQHKIRVDGETVSPAQAAALFSDQQAGGHSLDQSGSSGRPRVIDLAPSRERLFTVGRLDKTSEGLILATNDGQLTDLLTHPRYGVEKTYWALVAGSVSPEAVSKLERGVHLAEGYAHAKRVTVRRAHKQSTILEIVLDEGRNREVRRLLARIGHKVLKLRRIAIGPLRLGNMKPGENRPLMREEVEALYEAARERRRQSDKGTKKPTTRMKTAVDSQGLDASDVSGRADEVRPLIDHSLSPDELNEQDAISIDGLDDELHDGDSGNEPGFEGLADGDEFVDDSNQELATARVDLSPILPGKPGARLGADAHRRRSTAAKKLSVFAPPQRSGR